MTQQTKHEIPPDTPGADCNGPTCGATIYWIKVPYKRPRPDGKTHYHLCVNADGVSHWSSCPDVDWFRNKRGAKSDREEGAGAPT